MQSCYTELGANSDILLVPSYAHFRFTDLDYNGELLSELPLSASPKI